jgi:DNA-binding response OmpR family regulator
MSESSKIKIFLVEDDENFGAVLKLYLEMNDYQVTWVTDGAKAYPVFLQSEYQLCILDVMLPHLDGFYLARQIKKQNGNVPIIFLTAKTLKQDEIEGYRAGADDYIKKPFDSEVLLYKIQAILKRNKSNNGISEDQTCFVLGTYTFNHLSRTLRSGQNEFKLSLKESELLYLLCLRLNQVLSREEALIRIWGDDTYFTTRSMDVYIAKLRKYLQDDPSLEIMTIHGSGFRLVSQ